MRIFAHKNYKCGLFFPMRAGYAKPEINLPWPKSEGKQPIMAYCIHTAWYVGAAKRLLRGHPLLKP